MADPRKAAFRIAIAYAIVGVAWILLSDQAVTLLPQPVVPLIQSVKGFSFVVVTAVAVYLLVERLSERISNEAMRSNTVERMLGQVVSTVPVGVLLTSDDGTVTFINQAAEEMLGFTSAEAVGRGIDQICCADPAEGAVQMGELLRTRAVDGIDVGGHRGTPVRSVLARAAEIDPSMAASGWVIAIADITEAHRARAASERLIGGYRFLASALSAAMRSVNERALLMRIAELAVESGHYKAAWAIAWDEESGRYVDVAAPGMGARSLETASMMRDLADSEHAGIPVSADGFTVSNDIARDPANVWHPAAMEEGFSSSAFVTISQGERLVGGIVFFAEEVGAFSAPEVEILHSLRDSVAFAIGRMHLERNRLHAEHEGEDGYRTLFENNPAPMWVYDVESLAFLEVNEAAVAKYGYSRQEFLNMTNADLRPPEDVARFRESLVKDRGFVDAGVWTHIDKSGREFPVQIYAHTLDWEGHAAHLVMALEVPRVA